MIAIVILFTKDFVIFLVWKRSERRFEYVNEVTKGGKDPRQK